MCDKNAAARQQHKRMRGRKSWGEGGELVARANSLRKRMDRRQKKSCPVMIGGTVRRHGPWPQASSETTSLALCSHRRTRNRPITVVYRGCRRRRRTDGIIPRRKSEKDGRKKTMRHSRWKSCGRQVLQGFILRAPLAPGFLPGPIMK